MKLGGNRPPADNLIRAGFCYRVNVTSCNLCARAKVPGHRELNIEQTPSHGKIGRGILNFVAVALTVTELFTKVCEKV